MHLPALFFFFFFFCTHVALFALLHLSLCQDGNEDDEDDADDDDGNDGGSGVDAERGSPHGVEDAADTAEMNSDGDSEN